MALRPIDPEQDPRLAAEALRALSGGMRGPWSPSILDMLPVPPGITPRQAPVAAVQQRPVRQAPVAAPRPRPAFQAPPRRMDATPLAPQSRAISGPQYGASRAFAEQALEGEFGVGTNITGLAAQVPALVRGGAGMMDDAIRDALTGGGRWTRTKAELDRQALMGQAPPQSRQIVPPQDTFGLFDAASQVGSDIWNRNFEGAGAGLAGAGGAMAAQTVLDPLGAALGAVGGPAAQRAARAAMQRAIARDAERQAIDFLAPEVDIPAFRMPGVPQAIQATRDVAQGFADQAVQIGGRTARPGVVGPVNRRPRPEGTFADPLTPRATEGPDLPLAGRAFNAARFGGGMSRATQDRLRDAAALAAEENAEIGAGTGVRISNADTLAEAAGLGREDILAMEGRAATRTALNPVELAAANRVMRELSEQIGELNGRVFAERSPAAKALLQAEAEGLSRDFASVARTAGYGGSEAARTLAILAQGPRDPFDASRALGQALRHTNNNLSPVVQEEIVRITTEGQGLQRIQREAEALAGQLDEIEAATARQVAEIEAAPTITAEQIQDAIERRSAASAAAAAERLKAQAARKREQIILREGKKADRQRNSAELASLRIEAARAEVAALRAAAEEAQQAAIIKAQNLKREAAVVTGAEKGAARVEDQASEAKANAEQAYERYAAAEERRESAKAQLAAARSAERQAVQAEKEAGKAEGLVPAAKERTAAAYERYAAAEARSEQAKVALDAAKAAERQAIQAEKGAARSENAADAASAESEAIYNRYAEAEARREAADARIAAVKAELVAAKEAEAAAKRVEAQAARAEGKMAEENATKLVGGAEARRALAEAKLAQAEKELAESAAAVREIRNQQRRADAARAKADEAAKLVEKDRLITEAAEAEAVTARAEIAEIERALAELAAKDPSIVTIPKPGKQPGPIGRFANRVLRLFRDEAGELRIELDGGAVTGQDAADALMAKMAAAKARLAAAEEVVTRSRTTTASRKPAAQKVAQELDQAAKEKQVELLRELAKLERTRPLEATSAFMKANLLTGPGTTGRNVVGNSVFQVLEGAAQQPAALLDAMVGLGTGRRTTLGLASTHKDFAKSVATGAKDGWREAKETVLFGATLDDLAKMDAIREVNLGNSPAARLFSGYTNGVFRLVSAQDRPFRLYALHRRLGELARIESKRLQGIARKAGEPFDLEATRLKLRENPTEMMMADAIGASEEAVFANDTLISQMMSGAKQALRRQGVPGELTSAFLDHVLPFVKTPAAIFGKTVEYTPLGYAKTAYKFFEGLAKGFDDSTQRAMVQSFGRATTGAPLIALGYAMYDAGLMTPAYDPQQAETYKATERNWGSIRLPFLPGEMGKGFIPIAFAAPAGALLGIGAMLAANKNKGAGDLITGLPGAAASVMSQMPMLQGAQALADTAKPGGGGLMSYTSRLAADFPARLVPASSMMRDIAVGLDPSGQRPLTRGDDLGGDMMAKLRAGIPLARSGLPREELGLGDTARAPGIMSQVSPFRSVPALESNPDRPDVRAVLSTGANLPPRAKNIRSGVAATALGLKPEAVRSGSIDLTAAEANELHGLKGLSRRAALTAATTKAAEAKRDITLEEVKSSIRMADRLAIKLFLMQNTTAKARAAAFFADTTPQGRGERPIYDDGEGDAEE